MPEAVPYYGSARKCQRRRDGSLTPSKIDYFQIDKLDQTRAHRSSWKRMARYVMRREERPRCVAGVDARCVPARTASTTRRSAPRGSASRGSMSQRFNVSRIDDSTLKRWML